MSILITGAGMVGAQIANILAEQGETPILFDLRPDRDAIAEIADVEKIKIITGDMLSQFDLMNAVVNNGVTKIIHTVAFPGLTAGCLREPYKSTQLNIMSTLNVLEIARLLKLEKVVCCSTCGIHSTLTGGTDTDDKTKEEYALRTSTIYTTTKMCVENLVYNYANEFGVDAVAVRLTSVFGPWRHASGVISTVIDKALKAAMKGEEVILPNIPFDLIYSKDCAQGCLDALNSKAEKDRVFNIATGTIYTVEELAEIIKKLIPGSNVKIVPFLVEGKEIKVTAIPANVDRTRAQLGFVPKHSFEDGVAEVLKWIKAH